MPRRHGRQPSDAGDALERTRRAIRLLAEQRTAAKADAGTTLVSQAEVRRVLTEQRRRLALAHAEIRAAMTSALDSADGARADDGHGAAQPYEQAHDGLRAQLGVVESAQRQLDEVSADSAGHIEQAREVLRRSLSSLDGALREQLRQLTRLERLERDRLIAEARTSWRPDRR